MFSSLSDKLQNIFDGLRHARLTDEDVKKALREVRLALLEADVSYTVVKDFLKRVQARAVGVEITKNLQPAQQVIKIVNEELIATLGQAESLNLSGPSPRVIMLVGLQGSGKTTMAGKLALHLRREGRRPYLVACDTYRPAAVDQLVTLAKQIDIPYHEEGIDPKPDDIAKRGLQKAAEENASVVILDTAGRLQIDNDMMKELQRIEKVTEPAEILLVADAMTGQEAVNIAEGFNEYVDLSGLVLTKVDGDARGGAAISMRAVTGVPIKFMGTGEKLDALEVFYPDRLASRILGMGDVLTLIERAEDAFDEEEAERLQKKFMENNFSLEDFRSQIGKMRSMGPLTQLLKMVPGLGGMVRQLEDQLPPDFTENQLTKIEAIINSMTTVERERPRIINASRKRRIAKGSGTSVQDVNGLLKQFRQMKRMMKQLKKGKLPSILSGFR